ncbi:unnamed protein product [Urochloa decumbens]|uniref:Leucine-rich repeat-containing N-terminal plant-type domain-containing protein n=1 Tax=Urochloa decumbens TaxID=240449 RepID=A0ABC9ATT9_9POAL
MGRHTTTKTWPPDWQLIITTKAVPSASTSPSDEAHASLWRRVPAPHRIAIANSLHIQPVTGGACVPHEREALLTFKWGITGDPAGRLASWHQGNQDCCRWRGVRCSNRTGHVVVLHLRNPQVDNPDQTALSGQISPSLLSLHHLRRLDLSLNNLSGPSGVMPEFLGHFKSLRYLNLSGMPFSGRVPPQLGNLSKLHYLDVSNPLGRSLYSTDISWLSNLPLRFLNMAWVNLATATDWAHVVNMIPSLEVIRLPGCLTSANQSLPHLNLTNLEVLDLSWNDFLHPVASCWFWNLASLRYLELVHTGLYGQMPDALGAMTSLQVLKFSESVSSIDIMMASMKNLCNLEILDLNESNMNGDISLNNLSGPLPSNFGATNLNVLYLSSNQITGHIPQSICKLNLVELELDNNRLEGEFPQCSEPRITRRLILCNNMLSGKLEEILRTHIELEILNLAWNNFTGTIPASIMNIEGLYHLNLAGNSISGGLPNRLIGTTRVVVDPLSGVDTVNISVTMKGQEESHQYPHIYDGIFTQYPHIYDGNIGLCGNPLQTNCTGNSEPKHGDQKIDEDDSMVLRLSFGLGIGYVVGLWVVFCVILFKRLWRLAYFQVFDKAFDKAYVFLVVTWATWARKAPNH